MCKEDQAAAFSLPRFPRAPLTYATPLGHLWQELRRVEAAEPLLGNAQRLSDHSCRVLHLLEPLRGPVRSRTAANGDFLSVSRRTVGCRLGNARMRFPRE